MSMETRREKRQAPFLARRIKSKITRVTLCVHTRLPERYSTRKATSGSMRVARRAGR
jgi:hypothetical protein